MAQRPPHADAAQGLQINHRHAVTNAARLVRDDMDMTKTCEVQAATWCQHDAGLCVICQVCPMLEVDYKAFAGQGGASPCGFRHGPDPRAVGCPHVQ